MPDKEEKLSAQLRVVCDRCGAEHTRPTLVEDDRGGHRLALQEGWRHIHLKVTHADGGSKELDKFAHDADCETVLLKVLKPFIRR